MPGISDPMSASGSAGPVLGLPLIGSSATFGAVDSRGQLGVPACKTCSATPMGTYDGGSTVCSSTIHDSQHRVGSDTESDIYNSPYSSEDSSSDRESDTSDIDLGFLCSIRNDSADRPREASDQSDWYEDQRRLGHREFVECDGESRAGKPPQLVQVFDQADFSTRKPYDAFRTDGRWQAHPKALVCRFDLRDLREVDVVNGTFQLSGYFNFKYQGFHPKLSRPEDSELIRGMPRIRARNSQSGDRLLVDGVKEGDIKLRESEKGICRIGTVIEREVFSETFELQQFPFDVQDCCVHLALGKPDFFWLPVPGKVNCRTHLSEWYLLRPELSVYNQESGKPSMTLRFRLQRKWKWHVYNHMLLMGVLSTLSFYAFVIDYSNAAERANVTLTLLLTTTATKFLIADTLPNVSYSTVLDKYIWSCFGLTLLIALENFFVALFFAPRDDEELDWAWWFDRVFAGLVFICWLCWHAWLIRSVSGRLSQIRREYGRPWKQLPMSISQDALHNTANKLDKVL